MKQESKSIVQNNTTLEFCIDEQLNNSSEEYCVKEKLRILLIFVAKYNLNIRDC